MTNQFSRSQCAATGRPLGSRLPIALNHAEAGSGISAPEFGGHNTILLQYQKLIL